MLCKLLLQRGGIGQEFLVLEGEKLGVRGGYISSGGTTREDNPWRERAPAEIGDLANAIVSEKDAQDSEARCVVRVRCKRVTK